MNTNNIMPKILYPMNGGYVNNLNPTIQGTGSPGAMINGQLDNTPFSVKVSENGTWSYTLGSSLDNLSDHTLNLTQTDAGGKDSPAVTVTFKTDANTLMKHTVVYPANNQFINTNTPEICGTGKPGATIEAIVCNKVISGVVNTEGQWRIKTEALPEGLVSMAVKQKDQGNAGETLNVVFTVDTAAPGKVTLDNPPDQSVINNAKPVISGTGEPDAVVSAIVDEKEYATTVNKRGTWSVEIGQALMDDTHIISTKQKDKAGNISPEDVRLFTVKTKQPAPPVVNNPKNGSIIASALPVVTGTGETDCRVEAKIYNRIYAAAVDQNGAWEIRVAEKLNDGMHTFQIYQVDAAGNYSANTDLTVNIDTTVPAAPVILYPADNSYVNNTSFQVKGTGEPDATIQCSIAGVDYTAHVENDGSWAIQVANNENIKYQISYSISARQIDLAGNTSTCSRVNFKVDTECLKAPEITFPADNAWINTMNPVFTGKGKPGATVCLTVNNENYTAQVGSNGNWSINVGNSLPEGKYKAGVSQTDAGNLSASSTAEFNVQITEPAMPRVISPTENQNIGSQSVLVKGTGAANAAIDLRVDDKTYSTKVQADSSWEYAVEKLENGIHSLLVSQTDAAGNKSKCTPVNFVINVQQNVVSDDEPACYEILYNPPGPEWTRETIATFKTSKPVTVNNVNGVSFSSIITSNGVFNIDYTDCRGNRGTAAAAVTWIDNKPPIISIESQGNCFKSDKTVNYFTPCGSGVRYALINGVPFGSGTTVTGEGAYKAEVCNQVGNMACETFFIDKTPPTVTGIENNKTYHSDVTITYADTVSGIKSAMLNDQNILSGAVIAKNGSYTLTLTDNGDNKTVISFKIQK